MLKINPIVLAIVIYASLKALITQSVDIYKNSTL